MIIRFYYKNIHGDIKTHVFDYGSEENCIDVFNCSYKQCYEWFKEDIFVMVDDCEELLSWDIVEPKDAEKYNY